MRLATLRADGGYRTVVVADDDNFVEVADVDLGGFLARPDWLELAEAALSAGELTHARSSADLAPLVPTPSKIVCVGLNYRNHIQEMGRDLPEYPTLFAKFADALVGPHDPVLLPPETAKFDWEVELTVVIGREVRRAGPKQAEAAIAGFTVLNDVTCRDWQFRTREWLQGKSWDSTTPVGPVLVTPDELPGGTRPALSVRLGVDGETMQSDSTANLLFDPVALVEYISTMVRLRPGDLIATGTPGGVGHAREPARFMAADQTVVAEVEGIGRLENSVVADVVG